ncbi:MAG: tetratricopeptide repeat protein [Candidatus Obscuribacter sp.]|jgi:tetratricopeptide (TPR) repeat protein|nr:tetratricopeptide repeat protein [Candidatus Obscuribacter sp.]
MFSQNQFAKVSLVSIAISTILIGSGPCTAVCAQSKAKLLQDLGDIGPTINQKIKDDPNNSGLYCMRGTLKMLKDDYHGAINDFIKARDLGQVSQVHDYLGICYTRLKDYNSALNSYNTALSITPNSAPLLNNRGDTFLKLNRLKEAFADFSAALKLDSTLSDAYSNIGECYMKSGQYAYALQYFDKGISRDPKNFEAIYLRGTIYQKLGKAQAAAKDFAEAKRLGYEPGKTYFHEIF